MYMILKREAGAGRLTQVQPYPLTEKKEQGADSALILKMMQLRQYLPNMGKQTVQES